MLCPYCSTRFGVGFTYSFFATGFTRGYSNSSPSGLHKAICTFSLMASESVHNFSVLRFVMPSCSSCSCFQHFCKAKSLCVLKIFVLHFVMPSCSSCSYIKKISAFKKDKICDYRINKKVPRSFCMPPTSNS